MHDATNPLPRLRLAIAPGVSSSQLAALLARQRAEEPDVILSFHEVAGDALLEGLHEGRYDIGMSPQQGVSDPAVITHPLWTENMALAMPPRFRQIDQMRLTIADLQGYPIYRWPAEACSLLDEALAALMPVDQKIIQQVTSFEMMALWVAAGYGVGVSAQSRIERAHGWGITMRPLNDGPYQITTYLLRAARHANAAAERFERRVRQAMEAGTA